MSREMKKLDSGPVLELEKRVGRAKAAELIGVSQSAFTDWAKNGQAYAPIVLAARYQLSRMDREAGGCAVAIAVLTAAQRPGFEAMATAMGIDVKYVPVR